MAAIAAGVAFGLASGRASAAEITLLCSNALKSVIEELGPGFEKTSGHKLKAEYGSTGPLKAMIEKGRAFDVAIIGVEATDDLIKSGKLTANSRTDIARSGMGVAIRKGAAKPDLGTTQAFKQALLKAKSVGYIDPASGGSSGIYVAGLLDKLGIAEQIKPKAKLQKGGHVSDLVKAGEAEIGIHQNSEIVGQAGVTLVGPLPKDIQNYTTYAVGLGSGAKQAEAAKAFIKVLTGPSAAAVLKTVGMEGV